VRKPGTRLAPVHAELLQTGLDVERERRPDPVDIVEDEHPDAPGSAVAPDGEPRLDRVLAPQSGCDLANATRLDRAQERDREMEVGRRHHTRPAHAGERLLTPACKLLPLPSGDRIADEDAYPCIGIHGSRESHTEL
jgi:hypothetical protein